MPQLSSTTSPPRADNTPSTLKLCWPLQWLSLSSLGVFSSFRHAAVSGAPPDNADYSIACKRT